DELHFVTSGDGVAKLGNGGSSGGTLAALPGPADGRAGRIHGCRDERSVAQKICGNLRRTGYSGRFYPLSMGAWAESAGHDDCGLSVQTLPTCACRTVSIVIGAFGRRNGSVASQPTPRSSSSSANSTNGSPNIANAR